VRAGSAAEKIRLPPNIFRYCRFPWNKHQANRVLNHVILTGEETIRLTRAFERPNGTPEEKIQHHK
jgi:hypothetical protein